MDSSPRNTAGTQQAAKQGVVELEQDRTVSPHPQVPDPSPEAVREQLNRVLSSPRFASSFRCRALLTHVVEVALNGGSDTLKERNIGVDIFHRSPDYDTNADPTVRVAAGEVRKKLAQYYFEPGNHDRLRIELPTGSYAPVFSVVEVGGKDGPAAAAEKSVEVQTLGSEPASSGFALLRNRKTRFAVVMAAIILIALAGTFTWRMVRHKSAVEIFWSPVINSPSPVLLCTGRYGYQYAGSNGSDLPQTSSSELTTVILDDAVTLANVAGEFRAQGKPYSILSEAKTTYEDLQKGPAVLIGAYNNPWTMRFTQSMRYRFAKQDPDQFQWIADRDNPATMLGKQRINQGLYGPDEYAIVARITQPETKQPTIILAGVTPAGTLAAGNFVTSTQLLADFLKTAPKGWQSKNLEIVLNVDVVDNQPGPPRVVASVVW